MQTQPPQGLADRIRAIELSDLQQFLDAQPASRRNTMALQSNDEVIRVADEFFRNFCPQNLVKDGPQGSTNAQLIAERCFRKHGILTISNMAEAAYELGTEGKLALIPEPKTLTRDEQAAIFQKKEFVRIQRETAENAVPFSERVAAEKTKREADEWAKGQEKARAELGLVIMNYQCYGINHVDIGASEMVQKYLKGIRVPAHDGKGVDGKSTDYIATTAWVRAVIAELPDHPRLGDAESALKRVRESFAAQQEAKKDKNQGW